MKVSLEKIEKNRVALEIEVEADQVEQALNKAHLKLVKKVNIPGFRKGKAPRVVLERFIGKAALLEEAAKIMISPNYLAAVKETGIEPIDRPSVDIVQLEDSKPFAFKVLVDVKPEVTLGEYKGLQLEKKEFPVSEEDINHELERLQQRYAKLEELGEDDEIQQGDIANIAFEGFINGEPFEGSSSESYSLGIGSGSFIPGFEDQLVGARIDEKRDVNITFPEEYHHKELAGKEALFKVEIRGIRRKQLLPIDDEFAKDVSEFETLDDLKADIKKRLEENAQKRAEEEIKNQATSKAVEAASVEIPPVMIEDSVQRMIDDFAERLQMQGLSLEQYLQFINSDMDKLKDQYRPQAEFNVKTDLVLEAIAKKENIEVSDEDIQKEIDLVAKQYNQKPEVVKASLESSGRLEMLKFGIKMNKTVDFLVNNSNIV